jgi:ribosomal protein S18 acetylase RimI-like enzyme
VQRLRDTDRVAIAGFTCAVPGRPESPFESYVSNWIKNDVWLEMVQSSLEVFVYYSEESPSRLIGFLSLSEQRVEIANDCPPMIMATIPCLGIHGDFRSQQSERPDRYGCRILGGLIEEVNRRALHAFLMLEVDPENRMARELYEAFGFRFAYDWRDPVDGRVWTRMIRAIPKKPSIGTPT